MERSEKEDEVEYEEVVILTPPTQRLDQGTFVLPVAIGVAQVLTCLIDTGAGRNVLPESIYKKANLPPLKPFKGELWYGDQVRIKPEGIVNTEVRINGYPIPMEFVVVKA